MPVIIVICLASSDANAGDQKDGPGKQRKSQKKDLAAALKFQKQDPDTKPEKEEMTATF